jgi:5-methyltetrahydrofolate--homocysteine methyltransferase
MDLLKSIAADLEKGDDASVRQKTQAAIDAGLGAAAILDGGLLAGMAVVGERFRTHEIFLPEVLLAARAMHAGLALLKPLLVTQDVPSQGRVVIGTIRGDLHDIGKNLVGIMLQGAGFEVIDLGKDVPPARFVDTAVEREASVIGMSALLTTTMVGMKEVVRLLRERGLEGRIRTIVGGAPVSPDFAREIGADAYAFDAASAVDRVKSLIAAA